MLKMHVPKWDANSILIIVNNQSETDVSRFEICVSQTNIDLL